MREQRLQSRQEAVILLEDLEREPNEPQKEMAACRHRQVPSTETVAPGQQTSLSLQAQPEESQLTWDRARNSHLVGETE